MASCLTTPRRSPSMALCSIYGLPVQTVSMKDKKKAHRHQAISGGDSRLARMVRMRYMQSVPQLILFHKMDLLGNCWMCWIVMHGDRHMCISWYNRALILTVLNGDLWSIDHCARI